MNGLKVTDEQIKTAVSTSFSYSETLRKLGYSTSGSLCNMLKKHINRLQIDTKHFQRNKAAIEKTRLSISNILTKRNTRLHISHKRRLIEAGLLSNECSSCGIGPEWNGKPITLQVDHINGDCYDHRLENMRILCPNCHSQTSTWGGKNSLIEKKTCVDCSTNITKKAARCQNCANKLIAKNLQQVTKIDWEKVNLEKEVWEKPLTALSKELGVSDTAINKRCKRLGIKKPPLGYFLRKSGPSENRTRGLR
jgi:5-methylcytosine-specific restriction endonuclease McrA